MVIVGLICVGVQLFFLELFICFILWLVCKVIRNIELIKEYGLVEFYVYFIIVDILKKIILEIFLILMYKKKIEREIFVEFIRW